MVHEEERPLSLQCISGPYLLEACLLMYFVKVHYGNFLTYYNAAVPESPKITCTELQ